MNGGVLFVCLGNICRSPTAAGIARVEFERAGLDVRADSAGLGNWHVGDGADPRAVAAASAAGYDLSEHRARQFRSSDFDDYALVLAMDRANLLALNRLRGKSQGAQPALFLEFAGVAPPEEVPDPYHGGAGQFSDGVNLVLRGVRGLVAGISTGRITM